MAFRLSSDFVSTEGRDRKPVFGFNGLGELVYQRTYARYLGDDSDDREEWWVCTCLSCESWTLFLFISAKAPLDVHEWSVGRWISTVGSSSISIGHDISRNGTSVYVQQQF